MFHESYFFLDTPNHCSVNATDAKSAGRSGVDIISFKRMDKNIKT